MHNNKHTMVSDKKSYETHTYYIHQNFHFHVLSSTATLAPMTNSLRINTSEHRDKNSYTGQCQPYTNAGLTASSDDYNTSRNWRVCYS